MFEVEEEVSTSYLVNPQLGNVVSLITNGVNEYKVVDPVGSSTNKAVFGIGLLSVGEPGFGH